MKRTVAGCLSALMLSLALPAAVSAQVSPARSAPAAAATAPAAAPTAAENTVKKLFSDRFGAVAIDSVTRTPYGLYEVRIGSDLLYTDDKVSFVLDGTLIDAATKRNVTRERVEKLLAVNFDELPLDLAIKQVRGNGSRRIALFEDPNCGYCKQLRKSMTGIDNVTVYTFLYPILAPDSTTKSRAVWCSADRAKTWDDWMLNGKTPTGAGTCDTPIEKVVALGKKLQITGTPTIFFGDNTRVGGAMPPDQLKAKLDSMGKG
ncbi:DsbC family protein [Pigmentiphaga litoralis]|uniref:Thiol:disulfide interchange protein n=1 Tax=Pigmentiphaga litoralis TaxID=516702 RepID=A0A7Y9IRW6_9BURK|nr:DsbC family protein [Pigmentiphaga litoralis]NYE24436.1 thiol:disulfide interchange protein DsbC [Pigmentiphaga litoralis]NYE81950.1 thiol:disulfide interchange protein DsbC [Pigmentiphaga litoralis]